MGVSEKQVKTTDGGVFRVKALDGGIAAKKPTDDGGVGIGTSRKTSDSKAQLMDSAPLRRVTTMNGGVALVKPMDSRPGKSVQTLDGSVIKVKPAK